MLTFATEGSVCELTSSFVSDSGILDRREVVKNLKAVGYVVVDRGWRLERKNLVDVVAGRRRDARQDM